MSKFFNFLLLIIVSCTIIGCSDNSSPQSVISGKVIDGYISNAKVCIDLNKNRSCDANEPSTHSDSAGNYSLLNENNQYADYPLIAEITKGISIDSDEPKETINKSLKLVSPATVTTISSLTTLIYFDMLLNGKSLDTAHKDLLDYFGLDPSLSLLTDYIKQKESNSNYAKIHAISKTAFKNMDSNTMACDHTAIKKTTHTVHNSVTRTITVKNHCSGNAAVQFIGGAASAVPCSTSSDCGAFNPNLSEWICGSDNYCQPNDLNLSLGEYNSTTHAVMCKTKECCDFISYGSVLDGSPTGLCYYSLDGTNPTTEIILAPGAPAKVFTFGNLDREIVLSGQMSYFAGCETTDDINTNNCSTKTYMTSPTEFTLVGTSGNDFYDVSMINGISMPVMIKPEDNGTFTPSSDPYWCGAAGAPVGDGGIRSGLKDYGCSYEYQNDFNSTSPGNDNIGFNYVSDGNESCSTHSDCSSDEICGLSAQTVSSNETRTTCGKRVGYWTYAGLCSAPQVSSDIKYANSNITVDCATYFNEALCPNPPVISSPWSETSICGCAAWSDDNDSEVLNNLPIGTGYKTSQCNKNLIWSTEIEPKVKKVKEGCPTAYSYQYDDPYSTFQCRSNSGTINMLNYEITMCPEVNGTASEAGINFN
jgi:hypothetical protein